MADCRNSSTCWNTVMPLKSFVARPHTVMALTDKKSESIKVTWFSPFTAKITAANKSGATRLRGELRHVQSARARRKMGIDSQKDQMNTEEIQVALNFVPGGTNSGEVMN